MPDQANDPYVRAIRSAQSKTQQFEGWQSKPYADTRGIPTVGWGFNMQDRLVQKLLPKAVARGERELTKDEAQPIFNVLYNRAVNTAKMYLGEGEYNAQSPKMQGILNDMAYNLGDRLYGFKGMRSAILAKNMPKVAAEMENSHWYRQVGRRSKAHVEDILGEA